MPHDTSLIDIVAVGLGLAFVLGAITALGLVMLSRRTEIQPRLRSQFSRLIH